MSKQLRWKTLGKMNVERNAHSWTIRLVGKPEEQYLMELIKFLDDNKFVYKITNSSLKKPHWTNTWHVDPTKVKTDEMFSDILPTGLYWDDVHKVLTSDYTYEVLAVRGETIRICVYKNTTHLERVDRKEVF